MLPLGEAVRRLYAGTLPARSVAITFDDGGHDFYLCAYPILREFGYHVTLYLSTYYCRVQVPVFDTVISYILWKGRRQELDATGLVDDGGLWPLGTEEERQAAFDRIAAFTEARRMDATSKNQCGRMLAKRLAVDYDHILARRLLHQMAPEEIAQLAPDLVQVEMHTHRHRSPIVRDLFVREIEDNRAAIQEFAAKGSWPAHFCYPSGDSRPEFLAWLREAHVESAATCHKGMATSRTERLRLPRLVVTSTLPDIEFEGWLTGVASWLPARHA